MSVSATMSGLSKKEKLLEQAMLEIKTVIDVNKNAWKKNAALQGQVAALQEHNDALQVKNDALKTAHTEELSALETIYVEEVATLKKELAAKNAELETNVSKQEPVGELFTNALVMAQRETLAAEWRVHQVMDRELVALQEQVSALQEQVATKDAELAAKDAELADANAETNVPGEDDAATMKEELTAELRASMTLMFKQVQREDKEEFRYIHQEIDALKQQVEDQSGGSARRTGGSPQTRGSRQTQRSDNPHYVRNSFSSCPPPPRQ